MVERFNRPEFIPNDPISIPHRFTSPKDIEIAGLFAAVLAWGQRVTIIKSCQELLRRMDGAPYDFIMNHRPKDLHRMEGFKHRTFNEIDLLYFITFLKAHFKKHPSLENLFLVDSKELTIEKGLVNFHNQFFGIEDFPARTRKHIATPERHSACKRINMYLRWMVRHDNRGVDFGLWKKISPSQLVCPCDVHVERVARELKLIRRKSVDWDTAIELTVELRKLDPNDPVKYDFALFGLGVTNARRPLASDGR